MSAAVRIATVAQFAVMANLRNGLTRGGIALGSTVMLAGPVLGLTRDLAWGFDPDFAFLGFIVIALFGMRSGLQEQRELGMVLFFRHNIMTPVEHALAMIVSLLVSWVVLCAIVGCVILIVSGGDPRPAAWHTAGWGLRALMLLGFVPLVERSAAFRLPLLVPALMYFLLLLIVIAILPEDDALALYVVTTPGDLAALARLGLQALVALAGTCTLLLLLTATESAVERWIGRLIPGRR